MLYLVTHGMREGYGNPSHTDRGLTQLLRSKGYIVGLVSKIASQVPLILYGEGQRFWEAYVSMKEICGIPDNVPVKSSPILGTAISSTMIGGERNIILWDSIAQPEKNRISLKDLDVDWWKIFLATLPENTLLFSGAEFMRMLKVEQECHCCSFWVLEPCQKRAHCLVSRGERVCCDAA